MFQVTAHDQDKFRAAAADGLCLQAGVRLERPAPGAEEFRGASFQLLATECLIRSGMARTEAIRLSGTQLAGKLLSRHKAMSTDDFDSLLLDASNKTLQQAYRESRKTFLPITRITFVQDFKTIYGVALSEMADLDLIKEDQEYKHASLSDKQETYVVKKYGKVADLSREMIINDDLKAFFRLRQMFGTAAARKESDIVWALITGNPTMNDGYSLFSADHSNLEASTKGTITSARLQNGRKAMRVQTGPNGATLELFPRYMLIQAAQETDSEVLARSRANPEDNKNSETYNPWQSLTPISEPRLDANSVKAWYLVADPSQVDIIEMAFLEGQQEPYTEERSEFMRDVTGYKVRHEFGAQVMDHRGLWKNPGV